jgi:group I intron endonuclease
MIIYKITNNINGKVYIGQTIGTSLNRRFTQHSRRKYCIGAAIRKYGKENFTIEEIDGANSLAELNYLEQHYIYIYNSLAPNGYNLMPGGRNSTHTEETKKKMSESAKKKIFTKEHRENIGKKNRGNTNNKGRKFSVEARENMRRERLTRGSHSEATKQKMKEAWVRRKSACS